MSCGEGVGRAATDYPRLTFGGNGLCQGGLFARAEKILLTKCRRGLALFERRPAGESNSAWWRRLFAGGMPDNPDWCGAKVRWETWLVSSYRHGNRQEVH
ncbi:MAG TPA: hypothetical protein VFR42_06635, partial [Candidatus Acidoferrum sp.]|nr:hypothetical protein [Candidatus Acidoferrum sp.]